MMYQDQADITIVGNELVEWRYSIVETADKKIWFNVRKWNYKRKFNEFRPSKIGSFIEMELMLPIFKEMIERFDHSSNQSTEIDFIDK